MKIIIAFIFFASLLNASATVEKSSVISIDAYERFFYSPETSGFLVEHPRVMISQGTIAPKWLKIYNAKPIVATAVGGEYGDSGDGSISFKAQLNSPTSIVFDKLGNLYICDTGNGSVRFVDAKTRIIRTIGNDIGLPSAIALDEESNIYIANSKNGKILKIDKQTRQMSTFIEDETLIQPSGLVFSESGDLYISDLSDNSIKVFDFKKKKLTIYIDEDLNAPRGVAFDTSSNLYVADSKNHVVKKISNGSKKISVVAGHIGQNGFDGDGEVATGAYLDLPTDITFNKRGDLFISDSQNHALRKIDSSTGVILTIAGKSKTSGFDGDGELSLDAMFSSPVSLAFDTEDNLYIADQGNNAIRRINSPGIKIFGIPTVSDIGKHILKITIDDGVNFVDHDIDILVKKGDLIPKELIKEFRLSSNQIKVETGIDGIESTEVDFAENININQKDDETSLSFDGDVTNNKKPKLKIKVKTGKVSARFEVEHLDEDKITQTILESPFGTKVDVFDDGSIAQKYFTNESLLSVESDLHGNGFISFEKSANYSNAKREFKLKSGSKTLISEDGSVVSYVNSKNDKVYFYSDLVSANTKAYIKNSKGSFFALSSVDEMKNSVIEILDEETRALFEETTLVQHFESDRLFTLDERSSGTYEDEAESGKLQYDLSSAKNVQIQPSENSTFDETINQDGQRTIALTAGAANIIADGVSSNMVLNQIYLLPISSIDTAPNIPSFIDDMFELSKGWNLISAPDENTINIGDIDGLETIWSFDDGTWNAKASSLESTKGYWIKIDNDLSFDTEADTTLGYAFTYDQNFYGWQLIGCGEKIDNVSNSHEDISIIWVYGESGWIYNPQTLYQGQGLWIKR
jgi:sugar lactone lactonase YvrE